MSVLVRDIGGDREVRGDKVMKIVQCLQFDLVEGERVAVPCAQFPLLSLSSYPWLILALKRLG